MNSLIPIDTSAALPVHAVPGNPNYVLKQALSTGQSSATFDMSSLGLSIPPSNIVPVIARNDGSESIPASPSTPWTSTSFTCTFVPTPNGTFSCAILIFL